LAVWAFGVGLYAVVWGVVAVALGWLVGVPAMFAVVWLWATSISGVGLGAWGPTHTALALGWAVCVWLRLRMGGWWGVCALAPALLSGGVWAWGEGGSVWSWDPVELAAVDQVGLWAWWAHLWAGGAGGVRVGWGAGVLRMFRAD